MYLACRFQISLAQLMHVHPILASAHCEQSRLQVLLKTLSRIMCTSPTPLQQCSPHLTYLHKLFLPEAESLPLALATVPIDLPICPYCLPGIHSIVLCLLTTSYWPVSKQCSHVAHLL